MKRFILLAFFSLLCRVLLAKVAVAPSQGDGTVSNPYLISDEYELYWLSQDSSVWDKSFLQINDINTTLNAPTPIGTKTKKFTGSYDGGGYVIKYLNSGSTVAGLFGYTSGANIKRVSLRSVFMSGSTFGGALIGSCESSVVSDCYCTGRIDGDGIKGGLIGSSTASIITNCYSNCIVGSTIKPSTVGAFIGENVGSTIKNCFFNSDTSNYVVAAGKNDITTIDNTLGKTKLEMKTQSTFTDAGWDFVGESTNGTDDIWAISPENNGGYPMFKTELLPKVTVYSPTPQYSSFISSLGIANLGDGSPVTITFCVSSTNQVPTLADKIAEITTTKSIIDTVKGLLPNTAYSLIVYARNSTGVWRSRLFKFCTLPIDPVEPKKNIFDQYEIATLANLYWWTTHGRYDAVQVADIDASETANWLNGGFPIITGSAGSYYKNYNGKNHTISNLYISRPNEDYQGLFGFNQKSTIENVRLINVYIEGRDYVGGLCGKLSTVSTKINIVDVIVRNCFVSGVVKGRNYVGGLIGASDYFVRVSRSSTEVDVSGNDNVGGLIGYNNFEAYLQTSCSKGTVTGHNNIGGLVGYHYQSYVDDCYSRSAVSGNSNVGGFVGMTSDYRIRHVYSTGNVIGSLAVGALEGSQGTYPTAYCFFDKQTANNSVGVGVYNASMPDFPTGKTTAEMKVQKMYTDAGWDFVLETVNDSADIWAIDPSVNDGYPCFAWQRTHTDPVIKTLRVTTITETTAQIIGSLLDVGTSVAPLRGVCWSETNTLPTTADKREYNYLQVTKTGSYTVTISSLLPNTKYYVRCLIENEDGIFYGQTLSFVTLPKLPTISTFGALNITQTSFTMNGVMTNVGTPSLTDYGFCWSMFGDPTISDSKISLGASASLGAFSYNLTNLTPNTVYYVRAYATNLGGTVYGDTYIYRTAAVLSTVSTLAVGSVAITGAVVNGSISKLGATQLSSYGFCWSSVNSIPTIGDSKTSLGAKYSTGSFSSTLSGLTPLTKIFVRAYATNTAGTSYGDVVSFTTLSGFPSLTTTSASSSELTSSVVNGAITSLGLGTITNHGFCWSSTNTTPTITDSKIDIGAVSSIGAFSATLTNLTKGTKYYVRSYAINSEGTTYGDILSFTTITGLASVSTLSASSIDVTSIVANGSISSLGLSKVSNHGFCWSSTNSTPTIVDDKSDNGVLSTAGNFSATLLNLTKGTKYYIRAYAINAEGITYGSILTEIAGLKVAIAPALGDGTETNPYQIASLENLYWLSQTPSAWKYKFYIQTADIDASPTVNWPNGGWTPIGGPNDYINIFYNGQNHLISNLYINRPNAPYQGLFGYGAKSEFRNIGLKDVNITADSWVGGLVGDSFYQIKQCFVTGRIAGNTNVGGISGDGYNSDVENCYTNCEILSLTQASTIGGLFGYNASNVKFCYSATKAPNGSVGALVGSNFQVPISNCFWDSQLWKIGCMKNGGTFNALGKQTSEMKTQATFSAAGWDFVGETANGTDDIWAIDPLVNDGYPCFAWQVASAIVNTSAMTLIATDSAIANGTFTRMGATDVTSYGFCYSATNTSPTIADNTVDLGSATTINPFSATIKNLVAATKYYIRTYAKNTAGTVYGDVITFETKPLPLIKQTITLSKGWNLISLAVKPSSLFVDSIFAQIKTKLVSVKTNESFYLSVQAKELNTLTSLNVGVAYWINTSEAVNLIIEGESVTATPLPVLSKGWNMIGFAVSSPTSLEDAFGTQFVNLAVIKDENSAWLKGNSTASYSIEPGKAYLVKIE